MTPTFGQVVKFFKDSDDEDRSCPQVGIVTRAHGDEDNRVCLVAICPKTGGTTPYFNVPQNSNDTPNGPCWAMADGSDSGE